jgi:hypothetical protein
MDNTTMETQKQMSRNKLGYIRHGDVKIVPIKRSSDWLPPESDSIFLNTGAAISYVVPIHARTGSLVDPLEDLTDEQKDKVARELGLEGREDLNVRKPVKENFWINRSVMIDKNGLFLNLNDVGDFIKFKILQANKSYIAPSWSDRYENGEYKFAIVFEEEQHKLKLSEFDTKKEAYMQFGRIDGSSKKMADFLWIYYLVEPKSKRLPLNPSMEYMKSTIGSIIEESPGRFLSILTDPHFETKVIIQKAMNNGLIHRDGMSFRIFNENMQLNSLDELVSFLEDERNNTVRLSLIGKIEILEKGGGDKDPNKLASEPLSNDDEKDVLRKQNEELAKKLADIEKKLAAMDTSGKKSDKKQTQAKKTGKVQAKEDHNVKEVGMKKDDDDKKDD